MSLYQRLGCSQAISLVVDHFYDIMLQDKRVAHYFTNSDMKKQRTKQKQFISLVTGGKNQYQGQNMKVAHCKHSIGQMEFDATWQNLQKSLQHFKVPAKQTNQLKDIFYSVQGDIVNKTQQKKCPFNHKTLNNETKNDHKQIQRILVKEQIKCPISNEISKQQTKTKQDTLFDKLGGHGALYLVVNKFYQIMVQDSRVNYYFANTNMEKQKASQIQFLSMVTGGPNNYTGKDMKTSHCPYKIGKLQFDATWENLSTSLKYFGVKQDLLKQVKNIFYSVQSQIIWKKENHTQQNKTSFIVEVDNSSSDSEKLSQKQSCDRVKQQRVLVQKQIFQQIQMPITMKQSPNLLKTQIESSPSKRNQNLILKCPHLKAKLSAGIDQNHLSQNQKRKIRQQIMNKQVEHKQVKKLSNCPYNKIYY